MDSPMNEFHMAKGDALFLEGTSVMVMCAVVIPAVLVSWPIGGNEFKDEFYGDAALSVAGIGLLVGAALDYFAKKDRNPK